MERKLTFDASSLFRRSLPNALSSNLHLNRKSRQTSTAPSSSGRRRSHQSLSSSVERSSSQPIRSAKRTSTRSSETQRVHEPRFVQLFVEVNVKIEIASSARNSYLPYGRFCWRRRSHASVVPRDAPGDHRHRDRDPRHVDFGLDGETWDLS